jgi:chaperonin GroES
MKISPLHDRVVLERLDGEEVSKGGIIIPDSAKERPAEGKVLAVGPGKRGEDGKTLGMEVKKGDRVLFSKYAGTEVKVDGNDRIILREDEILAVIEG